MQSPCDKRGPNTVPGSVVHHLRIILRNQVHLVVQQNDVRVVIDSPNVFLPTISVKLALAVHLQLGIP